MLLVLLTAPVARADTPAAADDAIAKAKRDYEAIKAAKAGTDQLAPAALPAADQAPIDLHLTADLPPPSTAPGAKKDADKSGAGKKTGNWLVDAMADARPRDPRERPDPLSLRRQPQAGIAPGEADLLAQDRALAREKTAAEDGRKDREAAAEKRRTAEAANPLNRYLTAWMTPQDLALLNAKPATAAAPGAGALPAPGDLGPAGGPAPADLGGTGTGTDGLLPNFASPPPAAVAKPNPYLADLALPVPPPLLAPGAPLAPAPNAPGLTPAPAIAPAPANPNAPPPNPLLEQVQKAQDDAKYFKQLKRF